MDLPVHDDTSAYACPENHTEDDAGVRCRAIDSLRKREAIRIVLHADWPRQPGLKVTVEGLAVQNGAVRILKQASGGRDRPWGGNAHRPSLARFPFGERDQFDYGVQDSRVISNGRGDTMAEERGASIGAGIGQRNSLYLSATQINPYSHSRLHALWLNSPIVVLLCRKKRVAKSNHREMLRRSCQ
jgi:hypothetical protein